MPAEKVNFILSEKTDEIFFVFFRLLYCTKAEYSHFSLFRFGFFVSPFSFILASRVCL